MMSKTYFECLSEVIFSLKKMSSLDNGSKQGVFLIAAWTFHVLLQKES